MTPILLVQLAYMYNSVRFHLHFPWEPSNILRRRNLLDLVYAFIACYEFLPRDQRRFTSTLLPPVVNPCLWCRKNLNHFPTAVHYCIIRSQCACVEWRPMPMQTRIFHTYMYVYTCNYQYNARVYIYVQSLFALQWMVYLGLYMHVIMLVYNEKYAFLCNYRRMWIIMLNRDFFPKLQFGINYFSGSFALPLDIKTGRFQQPFWRC